MHKRYNGSAHAVIIIILVLVILGLLGFVFYQNFIAKKPSDTPAQKTSNSQQDSTNKSPATSSLAIVFGEWGVGADYDKAKGILLSKHDTSYGDDKYYLTVDKLQSVSSCSDTAAGIIYRFASGSMHSFDLGGTEVKVDDYFATAPEGVAWKKLGNYYYWYASPQQACAEDEALKQSQEDAVTNAIQVVKSLKTVD